MFEPLSSILFIIKGNKLHQLHEPFFTHGGTKDSIACGLFPDAFHISEIPTKEASC